MSTYQDVVTQNGALAAFALTEAAGLDFAPYIGGSHLTGSGTFAYRQAGPFAAAFGLQLNVGAKLALPFVATVSIPVSFECWYKFTTPPASDQYLFYNGAAATNGNGFYVHHADGHLHYFAGGGIADFDTGVVWPSSGWHLLTVAQGTSGAVHLYIDGSLQFAGTLKAPLAPSPNTLFIGGENGSAATVVVTVAMPDWANIEYTPQAAANTFFAATDPNAAFNNGGGSTSAILQAILNSVRKTF